MQIKRQFKKLAVLFITSFLSLPLIANAVFDPNDPFFTNQSYLRQVNVQRAWEITIGTPEVVIAVIDTGVDVNHPDLARSIWRNPGEIANNGIDDDGNGYIDDTVGWDFVLNSNDPRPSAEPPYTNTALNHGTLVAGILAAQGNNFEGIAGIAWGARIMPLRALNKEGVGRVEDVAKAVHYAIDNGADVINLSFVGTSYSEALYDALRRAYDNDLVVIVASGNTASNLNKTPLYPICFDAPDDENWIIGVSAVDNFDVHIPSANYGSDCVDVVAPGNNFFTTQVVDLNEGLSDAYGGPWSGTSLAAPVVSGVVALIKAAYPDLKNYQIIQTLRDTADNIDELNEKVAGELGKGRINADVAVTGIDVTGESPRIATFIGARLVAASNEDDVRYLQIYGSDGRVQQLWEIYGADFKAGGGIAVVENRPEVNPGGEDYGLTNYEISTIRRGDQRVVIGEGSGGKGRVHVYTTTGNLLNEWQAYATTFTGGISVASGDIFGDGEELVATAPRTSGGPHIRLFTRSGKFISDFFAYDKNLRGGWSVAMADVDGDGQAEIITSSTTLNLPVRVFEADGTMLAEWKPYPVYAGGINVGAGKISGSGRAQIVTVPVAGGGPNLRIFNMYGNVLGQFFVLPKNFRGGINLAIGDLNGDERDDIAITPLSRGGPQARFFDGRGELLGQFFVFPSETRFGTNLAIIR